MMERNTNRKKRHQRTRGKVSGTAQRPRFSVFRSNKQVYAQLIDDTLGHTLVSGSTVSVDLEKVLKDKGGTERAYEVGKYVAKKAQDSGITKVVFDRSGYAYHGQIKAVAEGAREGGLQF